MLTSHCRQILIQEEDINIAHFSDNLIHAHTFPCTMNDLNIDFATDNRPWLITQLLCSCLQQHDGKNLDETEVWVWSLNQRLQALLMIAQASLPASLFVSSQCLYEDCRERLELPLDLNLFRLDEQNSIVMCKPEEAVELEIRLPTGKDQRFWLSHASEDWEREMATRLVFRINGETPVRGWQLPGEWLQPIAQTLEAHDPFTVMSLETECPVCTRRVDVAFDLENYLLHQLERQQWQLKLEVHQLASFYHWSERDIVALPKNRREEYLHLIHESMPS